jgi:hypothetical protein
MSRPFGTTFGDLVGKLTWSASSARSVAGSGATRCAA